MTKLTSQLAVAALALSLHAGACAQAVTPDPDRNFIGTWSGTILVDRDHDASPVHLTITEKPDGSGTLWSYEFGLPGQKGHKTASKAMRLLPNAERLQSQWSGYPQVTFSTTGLEAFAQTGYGKFIVAEAYNRSAFLFTKHVISQGTFELQPDTMSYRWEVTTNGKSELYSHFIFHRDTSQNRTPGNGTTAP
ncbi:MAG: hypothetical protein V4555_08520 [Acidobacteriota bacterium]